MVPTSNMTFTNPITTISIGVMTAILCGDIGAEIPRKPPIGRYTGLWTNSPFTSKPPPPTAGPTINPLDDFTLTGIAPVPGGYRITIVSKKNAEVKKVIEPGNSSEFKVISVDRNPEKSLGTTVVLATGGVQGTVRFEPELVMVKAPPAAEQPPQPQNLPPGVNPAAVNNNPQTAQRQPRPRIVPPPTPANQNQAQPANNNNNNRQRGNSRERRRR